MKCKAAGTLNIQQFYLLVVERIKNEDKTNNVPTKE